MCMLVCAVAVLVALLSCKLPVRDWSTLAACLLSQFVSYACMVLVLPTMEARLLEHTDSPDYPAVVDTFYLVATCGCE